MANYGTILVVDDNPAILTAAEICLEEVFERVITLSTPEKILPTHYIQNNEEVSCSF